MEHEIGKFSFDYARSPEQYDSQYKSIYTKLWRVHFNVCEIYLEFLFMEDLI